jgi:hypothetical protein
VVSRQGLILVSSLVRHDLFVTIPAVCFLLSVAYLQSLYRRSSKLQLLLVSAEVNGLGLLEELRGTRLFETVAGARSATCCDKKACSVDSTVISLVFPLKWFTRLFMSAFSILDRNFSLTKISATGHYVSGKSLIILQSNATIPVKLANVCQSHCRKGLRSSSMRTQAEVSVNNTTAVQSGSRASFVAKR